MNEMWSKLEIGGGGWEKLMSFSYSFYGNDGWELGKTKRFEKKMNLEVNLGKMIEKFPKYLLLFLIMFAHLLFLNINFLVKK